MKKEKLPPQAISTPSNRISVLVQHPADGMRWNEKRVKKGEKGEKKNPISILFGRGASGQRLLGGREKGERRTIDRNLLAAVWIEWTMRHFVE